MKFFAVVLALIISLAAIGLPCPSAQAANNTAGVNLTVDVVSPLSVETRFAWPVTWHSAVLHGRLDDMGTDSSVGVYFEWGETTDYGSKTKVRRMTHTGRFSAVIHGLSPGTIYHFRAVAEGESTSYGSDESFKTKRHWWWPWW